MALGALRERPVRRRDIHSRVALRSPRRPDPARPKLDVFGAFLLTAALVTFVYTIESIPQAGVTSTGAILGIAVTLALFALFMRWNGAP